MTDFATYLRHHRQRCNNILTDYLDELPRLAPRLHEATQYALLNGGKRVRPILVYASAEAVAGTAHHTYAAAVDCAAAAVEAVHTYSLVHDDLPSMDDDNLRRGQPSCHVEFDEATAILVGDGLQTMAFQWLAQKGNATPDARVSMIETLACAVGNAGMVAGQSIDIAAVGSTLTLEQLNTMHRLKTGLLIEACVLMGAIATGMATPEQLAALRQYAEAIGLAFQVQDDILDVVGDTNSLGKTQGADAKHNKPTYVSLLGLEGAQAKALDCQRQAITALGGFDERAQPLRSLAEYIIARSH